jgi:hypothetical protein
MQAGSIEDADTPPAVLDQTAFLQPAGGFGDAFPAHAQHAAQ